MIFTPGVYEHAAAHIGHTPWEVSRDPGLLVKAHHAAWQCYRHDLVVAGIDVYNLEPEALGAQVPEPSGCNVPAIAMHPCEEIDELTGLPVLEPLRHPRMAGMLDAARQLQKVCAGAQVRVPVCGPFALAIGLMGLDNLLVALAEDADDARHALKQLLPGQFNYLRAIGDAGLRPLFFESGATPPLLPVALFESVERPLLTLLFEEAEGLFGERPPCIIGGDAAPMAEAFLQTRPDYVIAPSETDQAAFLNVAAGFPETHVRVNLKGLHLLKPDFAEVRAEADRVLTLVRERKNVSVGCGVVPFEADPEQVCRLRNYVASAALS